MAYASKGIIAGWPLAPTLSKLAVGGPIRASCRGRDVDYVGTWIDDISVDTQHRQAERGSAKTLVWKRQLADGGPPNTPPPGVPKLAGVVKALYWTQSVFRAFEEFRVMERHLARVGGSF